MDTNYSLHLGIKKVQDSYDAVKLNNVVLVPYAVYDMHNYNPIILLLITRDKGKGDV